MGAVAALAAMAALMAAIAAAAGGLVRWSAAADRSAGGGGGTTAACAARSCARVARRLGARADGDGHSVRRHVRGDAVHCHFLPNPLHQSDVS